jgi:uncharacterized protein YjeT (DUF2065 family)
MSDLAVGLGLVLVLEGLLWGLFPGAARKFLEVASSVPEQTLRLAGTASVALGVLVIWMVRG